MLRALLISTYDLGRQPLGLAWPAAALRAEGIEVRCADTSRQPLRDEDTGWAELIAFYLPMHTATRLAAPLIDRVRATNPAARLAAYGLYAPLNAAWLRDKGIAHVLGPDAEEALVALARGEVVDAADSASVGTSPRPVSIARVHAAGPDRTGLPPLSAYAALQMPDGSTRVAGNTEATRGCKHLCRHCPIVPVYRGRFSAVPLDTVMDDVRTQVSQGAEHITFGDPDFLNGPTHARRLIERLHQELPSVTYDATIKIEHLVRHADMLPRLRDTGCLFITSAVESVDDHVLEKLRKGHTRADFIRAVGLCREADLILAPTFVPFTPWTTVGGYVDLLNDIEALDLVGHVAPIQLAIRLLVTAGSSLLELDDIRALVGPFEPQSLTWPWRSLDPAVDALQQEVMRLAGTCGSRGELFEGIAERAFAAAGRTRTPGSGRPPARVPALTEAWYCCAEPMPVM
jgi:radical SAM superfamily enzyme YgiQ (UPF0313 family)